MADYARDYSAGLTEPDPTMVDVVLARRMSTNPQAQALAPPACFEYLVKCVGMSYLRVTWLPYQTIMAKHQA